MAPDRLAPPVDAPLLALPGGARVLEVRTTHCSFVYLTERDAYKVKRPVRLPFLDFSSLEQRRRACEAELLLNRRLATDVYRDVVPVTEAPGGGRVVGGSGALVDYAVVMRRLADADRADVRLRDGRLDVAAIDRVAGRIAAFHRAATPASAADLRGVVAAAVAENFATAAPALAELLTLEERAAARAPQERFLLDGAPRFAARGAGGHVRDGHGDLRLEHVYLGEDGSLDVLDCVEFDDQFRVGDVASDVAFLSMDLAFAGRRDLGERFLASYAEASGDYDLYDVVDFYEAYRAFVRGKIEGLKLTDPALDDEARAAARADARRYFLLARAASEPMALPPQVVAVGGLIGVGKSTVANLVALATGAPIVSADRTRKQMLGVAATEHIDGGTFRGAYDPTFTDRVYDEVRRRAARVLESGRSVVLDASFRSQSMRAAARDLALSHAVPFRFLECQAPLSVIRARLASRESGPVVSDARLPLLEDFAARFEAVTELSPDEHVVVSTDAPLASLEALLPTRLATWPRVPVP